MWAQRCGEWWLQQTNLRSPAVKVARKAARLRLNMLHWGTSRLRRQSLGQVAMNRLEHLQFPKSTYQAFLIKPSSTTS